MSLPETGSGDLDINVDDKFEDEFKNKATQNMTTPIAVIGMACRLPGGVNSLDDYWKFCAQGRSGWCETPLERFNTDGFYHPNPQRRGILPYRGAHYLKDDIALFDAPFFNITAKQAEAMDPQQRLLLECAYEALENGGITLKSTVTEKVGVFIGASFADYTLHLYRDTETTPTYTATGCDPTMFANRISYSFGFKGPSMTIDTACSSSITALHMACQSIRAGEITMALVGGCHLNILPDTGISLSMTGLISPDGRSYAFDSRAKSGFGRGEGVSCIVIRPLSDAVHARDPIHTVIRNTGVSHDGRKAGITLPSSDAQESLIRSTYRGAGIDPQETQYVEAHGTGTAAGDPIEACALGAIFGRSKRSPGAPIYVGSVKSNIGHLEGASGVAGLIKAALMLEKGLFLPNHDFQQPNENIPLQNWNMKVPTTMEYWPRNGNVRRASISNFGFGGSNGHAILEEPPQDLSRLTTPEFADKLHKTDRRRLYILTGNDDSSVRVAMEKLAMYLQKRREGLFGNLLNDLAHTLCNRRTLHPWRFATHAESIMELATRLRSPAEEPARRDKVPRLGFVFTGQGAQWYGMGRELIDSYPTFHDSIRNSEKILTKLGAKWSLTEELMRDVNSSQLGQTNISQPACTAVQIALVDLLKSWMVLANKVVGHSSGEIAAAYAAGILTADCALAIAFFRGECVQMLRVTSPGLQGSMLAVGLSDADLYPLVNDLKRGTAVVACINSHSSCTVSGDLAAISELEEILEERGHFHRRLHVDVAYHSHHMEYAAENYRHAIGEVTPIETLEVQFYSSLTGSLERPTSLTASYWVDNLTSPVLFAPALENLIGTSSGKHEDLSIDLLIEIGPHPALKGPIEGILKISRQQRNVRYLPTLIRERDAVEKMLDTVSVLFNEGYTLNLDAINLPMSENRRPIVLTNLPTYGWRHREKYWSDSRIAHQHCARRTRHDILGSLSDSSSDIEPVWRNIVRLENMPWLRDHQVQALIIYPMCGYLSMAMQAMYQYSMWQKLTVESFVLREVSVPQALVLSEDSEVEMSISLRPFAQGTRQTSELWKEFVISSWNKIDGWKEHCRGLISISGPFVPARIPRLGQAQAALQSFRESISIHATDLAVNPMDPSRMYRTLEQVGVRYGPAFQGLQDIYTGCGFTMANLCIPDTVETIATGFENEALIHPRTLDICCQTTWPNMMALNEKFEHPYVPIFIESITIRLPKGQMSGRSLRIISFTDPADSISNDFVSSFIATDQQTPEQPPLIEWYGIKAAVLPIVNTGPWKGTAEKVCFKPVWNTYVSTIPSSDYQQLFSASFIPESPSISGYSSRIILEEQASLYYMDLAVNSLVGHDATISAGRHGKLWNWMRKMCQMAQQGSLAVKEVNMMRVRQPDTLRNIVTLKSSGAFGELVTKIGENLPRILQEEIEPLELMVQDELLNRCYQSLPELSSRMYPAAAKLVELLVHENPKLAVLEIGAGTGGLTWPLLKAVAEMVGKVQRYDFTDISSSFFEPAKVKLAQFSGFMQYRMLDIETDPIDQGFDAHSYDLIVASQVLHATSDIIRTMGNVRKLLKPGGKILLIEITRPSIRSFPFATLPGWWHATDGLRENGPTLSLETWKGVLLKTGFSGIDGYVDDYHGEPVQQNSMIISTALPEVMLQYPGKMSIICSEPNQRAVVERLQNGLTDLIGYCPPQETFEEAMQRDLKDGILVILDQASLFNIDAEQFARVQRIVLAQGILWVTQGATQESVNPTAAMVTGLFRVLRLENSTTRLVTLDFDMECMLSAHDTAAKILAVIKNSFLESNGAQGDEYEYSERGGILQIPRFMTDQRMDQAIMNESSLAVPTSQPFSQEGRPLQLAIGQPGLFDTLHFTDDLKQSLPLNNNEIQMRVHSVGLIFKDVLLALGEVPGGSIGSECSGVITDVGPEVIDFTVGDRVCAICFDAFATFARCPSSCAVKIPKEMSFVEGASVPVAYATAYHALVEIGNLRRGERVLIHAAGGAVGQASIMISQMIGAEIFATVGTPEKKKHLTDIYQIPPERIFQSRDTSFGADIMRATYGEGVDLALNSLADDALRVTWQCVADFGRFIEIGKKDMLKNTRIEMAPFERCVTFSFVDISFLIRKRTGHVRLLLDTVMELLQQQHIRLVSPLTVYPVSDVEAAFRTFAGGGVIGKMVIDITVNSVVKATPSRAPKALFRKDGSYLITGGGGGLGRALATWMVSRGARNIILASRRGPEAPELKELCESLRKKGASIYTSPCDVSVKEQVSDMINNAAKIMPPICGVFHGAMVLRDTHFEQMKFEEYMAVIRPKIHGAWNLHHNLLTANLDFFVMLSSIAGILGNHGQAAYAAASTFLGSFTHFRHSLGLPAECLYLGPIHGIGYVAENPEQLKNMENAGFNYLTEAQFLALCTVAVNGGDNLKSCNHEAITCLGSRLGSGSKVHASLDSKFRHCISASSTTPEEDRNHQTILGTLPIRQRLESVESAEQVQAVIEDAFSEKLCRILSLDRQEVNATKPLSSYGIDSLSAVEMRNWITRELGTRLSLVDVRQKSVSELARKSVSSSKLHAETSA